MRHFFQFWEVAILDRLVWSKIQRAPEHSHAVSGCHSIVRWEAGKGTIAHSDQARVCGLAAWQQNGIAVAVTGTLYRCAYTGHIFDCTVAAITPKNPEHIDAIATFVQDDAFPDAVRQQDQALSVTEGSFLKVPFDLARWQAMAAEKFPNGLPEPHSDDPTQWLFKGDLATSTDPLQVAVARLLRYRWPDQPKSSDAVDALADADGIVCLPSVRGKPPAAERLLEVLHAAYGEKWSDAFLHKLLTDAGCKPGTTLDDWLRHQFFEQHCKRFHQRPFVWHITDGRHKDGFSALVNYHKLIFDTYPSVDPRTGVKTLGFLHAPPPSRKT